MNFSAKTKQKIFEYFDKEHGVMLLESDIQEVERIIQTQEIEEWINDCKGRDVMLNEKGELDKNGMGRVIIKSVTTSDIIEPRFRFEVNLNQSPFKIYEVFYCRSQDLINYFNEPNLPKIDSELSKSKIYGQHSVRKVKDWSKF